MQTKAIHHASVIVTDLDRSRRFYGDVLGLREIPKPSTFDIPVVWFEVGEQQIHLIAGEKADSIGSRHFALHIDDAKAAREMLAREGIETRETIPIPGCDRFFIRDPDENLIELMEWSTPYPSTGA